MSVGPSNHLVVSFASASPTQSASWHSQRRACRPINGLYVTDTYLSPPTALFLFGYIASSLYLLEHAIWSQVNSEAERETDVEAFKRWVVEGGLIGTVEDAERTRNFGEERVKADLGIVYGASGKARL